jgi:hypothetical protein
LRPWNLELACETGSRASGELICECVLRIFRDSVDCGEAGFVDLGVDVDDSLPG